MIEKRERGNPREPTGKFTISLARKKLQMTIIFQFVKHVPRVRHATCNFGWIGFNCLPFSSNLRKLQLIR